MNSVKQFEWPRLFANNTQPERPGLVLSGGGARASFQLGALTYLYREVGIAPEIFVGTSAGSILSAALAQFASPGEQAEMVERLKDLWFSVEQPSDMFIERPWFAKLRQQAPEWMEMVSPKSTTGRSWLPIFGKKPAEPEPKPDPQPADPIAEALRPDVEDYDSWSASQLLQLLSQMGKLGRAGTELPSIWHGADRTRSCYRQGPMLKRLLAPEIFQAKRVQESGMVLRMAMVGLESGQLYFMREDGRLVNRFNEPEPKERTFDLAAGVLASCSIPAVFVPVRLGEETFVDGGAREPLPAEMAMGCLETNPTYMVVCTPPGVEHAESMANADIAAVTMRSASILMDESIRDEIAYARRAGAIVIEPELNVHDSMDVDRGLFRINHDYGWMRAAEAANSASTSTIAANRKIIELRMRAHRLEQTVLEDPDSEEASTLKDVKTELKTALEHAPDHTVPSDACQWWQTWEDHPQMPTIAPTWIGN